MLWKGIIPNKFSLLNYAVFKPQTNKSERKYS